MVTQTHSIHGTNYMDVDSHDRGLPGSHLYIRVGDLLLNQCPFCAPEVFSEDLLDKQTHARL